MKLLTWETHFILEGSIDSPKLSEIKLVGGPK